MKKQKQECFHDWTDICQFRTVDGKKFLQQKCDKCKQIRYLELSQNDQNSSENEEKSNDEQ